MSAVCSSFKNKYSKQLLESKSRRIEMIDQKKMILLNILTYITCLLGFITTVWSYECITYKEIDVNDMVINDFIVRCEKSDLVCAKARMFLAFKIEQQVETNGVLYARSNQINSTYDKKYIEIGYLRVGNVLKVHNNCPISEDRYNNTTNGKSFLMSVEFECGDLQFTFERDSQKYYLSKIQGSVKLGIGKFNGLMLRSYYIFICLNF